MLLVNRDAQKGYRIRNYIGVTHGNKKRLGQTEKKFSVKGKWYNVDELSEAGLSLGVLSFISDYLDGDAVEVMTSGSTGKPKPIEIKVEHMRASAISTLTFLGLKPGDSCLLCLSPEYIAGMMMLVRWIEGDLDLYFTEPSNQPLQNIDRKIDLVAMVPYQVHHSLDQLSKLNNLLVGGGSISMDLESDLKSGPCRVWHSYGMTETITHIALREIYPHFRQTYRAIQGVNLSVDQRSCLVINAPSIGVFKLVTNDVVDLQSEVDFHWLGRYDNVVNSGGIKLFPEELERELGELEFTYFFAGIPDPKLGQKLVMIIETESKENLRSLNSNLESLGKYRMPKEVKCIPEFDRTASGKLRRQKTLQRAFPAA